MPAGTRPVSDRAREGLFSSLGPAVEGARVLDLYAGTGAMGIEALSRGAEEATFVDSRAAATRTIYENLERTGLVGRARILRRDAPRFLHDSDERYDLVLADPPYDIPQRTLNALVEGLQSRLEAPGWTVALTRRHKGYIPVIPVNWHVARRLRYGDTLILVCQEV